MPSQRVAKAAARDLSPFQAGALNQSAMNGLYWLTLAIELC
tara:strand:+ start:182298 stop:182420 length:123 start_codon:yes stop_codon:yes gene_type:complete